MSVEEYLNEAGRPPSTARRAPPIYLVEHEQQLLARYRQASPRWQLTLRLLSAMPPEDQEAVSESLNALLTKITDPRSELSSTFSVSRPEPVVHSQGKTSGRTRRYTR